MIDRPSLSLAYHWAATMIPDRDCFEVENRMAQKEKGSGREKREDNENRVMFFFFFLNSKYNLVFVFLLYKKN